MDRMKWRPMATAPRDGRQILVKPPRHDVFIRVAWDGRAWVSGTTPVLADGLGWAPMPEGGMPASG